MLVSNILDLTLGPIMTVYAFVAGHEALDAGSHRICPRHIQLSIAKDMELMSLAHAIIPQGGVLPAIHPALFPQLQKRE